MSSRFALVAGALLTSIAALPLSAQQSTGGTLRDTAAKAPAPRTASSDSALVELSRAISALATTVQTVVEQTAKNPEVRAAAVQTAGKAVTLAQRTLQENEGEIERLLTEASRKLSAAEATEKARAAEKTKAAEKAKPSQTAPAKP